MNIVENIIYIYTMSYKYTTYANSFFFFFFLLIVPSELVLEFLLYSMNDEHDVAC